MSAPMESNGITIITIMWAVALRKEKQTFQKCIFDFGTLKLTFKIGLLAQKVLKRCTLMNE